MAENGHRDSRKILSARITAMPESLFDPMPKVMVTVEGGEGEVELFEYYPDELSFTAEEFIGLTVEEGHQRKLKKDMEFIRSP